MDDLAKRFLGLSWLLVAAAMAACSGTNADQTTTKDAHAGSQTSTDTITDENASAATPVSGVNLTFTVDPATDPTTVGGYVVGDQSRTVQSTKRPDGTYAFGFQSLPAGSYDLIITAGKAAEQGVRVNDVVVKAGQTTNLEQVKVPLAGSVSGKATLTGQKSSAGIDAYIPGTTYIAKTADDGSFSIPNVPVGDHDFYFDFTGYARGVIGKATVASGQALTLPDMTLVPSTGASGQLLLAGGQTVVSTLTIPVTIVATPDAVSMMLSEDPTFSGLEWTPLVTSTTFTLGGTGQRTVYLRLANASGLVTTFSASVTYQPAEVVTTMAQPWTWRSGSNLHDPTGSYGHLGVAAPGNQPPPRYTGATWTDASGNLWLFGGYLSDAVGALSDLWRFDGTNWTWMAGSNQPNQPSVYVATSTTPAGPGARTAAAAWTDRNGVMWLFGGWAGSDVFNDLWKFDGGKWTFVMGGKTPNQAGAYGTQGVPSASNLPPARSDAATWIDNSGVMWLFGGSSGENYLNDLWKFDGTTWTWVAGGNEPNLAGNYGTLGVPSATSQPGAREGAVGWVDRTGHLWLFGGESMYDEATLNDLWSFDGHVWTWVAGSNTSGAHGTYGTIGVPAAGNAPASRSWPSYWVDANGFFWLFGGYFYDPAASAQQNAAQNDLWKFDGTTWTWVAGSSPMATNRPQAGVYGTLGIPAASNLPGARQSSMSWTDGAGHLWLFGGAGFDAAGGQGQLNDLWELKP